AVHEAGHWLSLSHTFALDASCLNITQPFQFGGDHVSDTPPQSAASGTCDPSGVSGVNCLPSQPVYGNNHMDYSPDACKVSMNGVNPFTPGQVQRMHDYLDIFIPEWTSHTNRILTGIENSGCVSQPVPFTAEFYVPNTNICAGTDITISSLDISYLPAGYTLQWQFVLSDGTTTINFPSAGYSTGPVPAAISSLGMPTGLYQMTASMLLTDQSNNVTTLDFTHPTDILVEDCSASAQRYTRTYDFGGRDFDNLSIVATHSGDGYIISGTDRDVNTGVIETIIIRADLFGNIVWKKDYSNNGREIRALDILQNTNTGNTYVITGAIENATGVEDVLLMEIDNNGDLTAIPGNPFMYNIASGSVVRQSAAFEIIQTSDNGFALAGYAGDGLNQQDSKEQLILKLDQNFNLQWAERYDYSTSSTDDYDVANSIVEITNYQNPAVTAYFLGGARNRTVAGIIEHSNSSMLIEDNGTSRTVAWKDTWVGNVRDHAYDALYDPHLNVIYQASFNSERHGMVIAKLRASDGQLVGWRDSKLAGVEDYYGTQLLMNHSGDSLVMTGYGNFGYFQPSAERIDTATWSTFGNIQTGNGLVRSYDVYMADVLQNHQQPIGWTFSDFYAYPKSTTHSPNGGYMIVKGGIDAIDNINKLSFIKVNNDLRTACQIDDSAEPDINYQPSLLNPVVTSPLGNTAINTQSVVATEENVFPCTEYCEGTMVNSVDVLCGNNQTATLTIDQGYPVHNVNLVWSNPSLVQPTNDPRIFQVSALQGSTSLVLQGFSSEGGCQIFEQVFNISSPAGQDITITDCGSSAQFQRSLCALTNMMNASSETGKWYINTVSPATEFNLTNYGNTSVYPYATTSASSGCSIPLMITVDATPLDLIYQITDPVTGCVDESTVHFDYTNITIDANFDPATATAPYYYWDFRQYVQSDYGQFIFTCSPNDINMVSTDQNPLNTHGWKYDGEYSGIIGTSTAINPTVNISGLTYGSDPSIPGAMFETISVEHTITSMCGKDTTEAALIIVPEINPQIQITQSGCLAELTVNDDIYFLMDFLLNDPDLGSIPNVPAMSDLVSVIWRDGSGFIVGSGRTFQPTTDGTYSAEIHYFNGSCTASVSTTVTGTGLGLQAQDIILQSCKLPDGTGTFDLVSALNSISSNPNANFVFWADAALTIPVVNLAAYNAPAGDIYVVVTTPDGCYDEAIVTLQLSEGPQVQIKGPQKICEGEKLELLADITGGTAPYIVEWTYNNGNNTWNGNPLTILTQQGVSVYTVEVTDANGCSNSTDFKATTEFCCPAASNKDYFQVKSGSPDQKISGGNYVTWPDKVFVESGLTVIVEGAGSVLDITNADVVFGECARIQVRNGARIISNNAVLRPCDETLTWQGVEFVSTINAAPSGSFTESTFINATTGLNVIRSVKALKGTPIQLEVSNNLFLNNRTAINNGNDYFEGTISGNTFRLEASVVDLLYCTEQKPEGKPSTGFTGVRFTYGKYPNYSVRNLNVISQNDFVKAMSLVGEESKKLHFNGIVLSGTIGTNITTNRFTNNDQSIVMDRVEDVSVENNTIEVTRRSNADLGTYQITFDGVGNYPYNALIQHNEILNTAELYDESGAVNSNGDFVGTGAIYVSRGGKVDIEDNHINGFEIGIFIDNYKSAGIFNRIVNNKIEAHLYGIYQRGIRYTSKKYTSFIGCNTIEMLLDTKANTLSSGTVGYYLDYTSSTVFSNNAASNAAVSGNVFLFGNCIMNTTSAIKLVHTNPSP
ncbi:MAG: M43 family zinc metalloprotease, partial [Cyclobacteriaceae bacterium]